MRSKGIAALLLMVPLVAVSVAGCRTAAMGAAGAAAAIILTDQGAESLVQGSLADVDRRTRAVLREMGMQVTDTSVEDNATELEYEARSGDRVVHVELERRDASTTMMRVSSREGQLDFDKDHARSVIDRVQRHS